jgi:hypothetical protein
VKFLKPALQILVLAVIAFAIWRYLFPPPEKVIRRKVEALAQTISENPQGNISRVANVNRIGGFFHPNVSINLEGFGREVSSVSGRGELEQMAMGVRQNNFRIVVKFSNIHVEVDPDKTRALAIVTAEVRLNDQAEPVVQDIRLGFEKYDRAWLIRSAEPAKAFKIE